MPRLNETKTVYANVVQISAGAFDLILDFGYSAPENRVALDPQDFDIVSRVVMSPGHAKSIIPILAKIVSDYETQFGVVPAPGFGEASRG